MKSFLPISFFITLTIGSSSAFVTTTPTYSCVSNTKLDVSSSFGDPQAELPTVNGSLYDEEKENPNTVVTSEAVNAYESAPLARVDDEPQEQDNMKKKYTGLGGTAPPSKRQRAIGLLDIIQQQKQRNLHVYSNHDVGAGEPAKRFLNTEFTSFL